MDVRFLGERLGDEPNYKPHNLPHFLGNETGGPEMHKEQFRQHIGHLSPTPPLIDD
jgi:hypothetical protein